MDNCFAICVTPALLAEYAKCAIGTRPNAPIDPVKIDLATLCYISSLVTGIQKWQEGCEAQIRASNVNLENLIKCVLVRIPEIFLNVVE